MRTWDLSLHSPSILTLAADAHFPGVNYCDDQIWEVNLTSNTPPALIIQTTFGLRARSMQLYPRFSNALESLTDPKEFYQPPRLVNFSTSYLAFIYSPFLGIDVFGEYWVPESNVITGRFSITNRSVLNHILHLDWIGVLHPLGEGQSMMAIPMGVHQVLHGKTNNLHPVCFMTGNPLAGIGSYPSLSTTIELNPGGKQRLTWAMASLPDQEASFQLARQTATRQWDAEIAQLERTDESRLLEIHTGSPDWDAALAFSQKAAYGLIFPAGDHLPHPSFVQNRQPDQGYSPRGDGSDHPSLWSGQTVLDTWYLTSLILPGGSDLATGWIENFLHIQDEEGFIDWKPGLGGQRSHRLAQPMLAHLACQISQYKPDRTWIEKIYPNLIRYLRVWFTAEHDRDGDGFPEWDHPVQSGIEDSPIYDRTHALSQGLSITHLESPALAALLIQECNCLLPLSRHLQDHTNTQWLLNNLENLTKAIEDCWDNKSKTYHYRDAETHTTKIGSSLLAFRGPGILHVDKSFRQLQRIHIYIQGQSEHTRIATIRLKGQGLKGPLEEDVPSTRIHWINRQARYTTQNVFKRLSTVEVDGISDQDSGLITTPDYTLEDISLLIPLWAGIPSVRRAHALLESTILHRYLQAHGLPFCPPDQCPPAPGRISSVSFLWNQMVGEALLNYGFRAQAADLVSRLMDGVIASLKSTHSFRAFYPSNEGKPLGEMNILHGLAPLGLFMKTLGIEFITADRVILNGFNPYPWPVTVKYQGITIICHSKETTICFSNGQSVTHNQPGRHHVFLT